MRITGLNLQIFKRRSGRLPIFPIFAAGFVLGIFIMNMGKSILLEDAGLLDEYTLYHMKYMTVNSDALFYYVLRQRVGTLILMAVFATTYLGLAVCVCAVLWYGIAGGIFVSVLFIRYGVKGILFVLAGLLPQYLLYIPAMIMMVFWCERLCRGIYFRNSVYMEQRASSAAGHPYLQKMRPPVRQLLRLVGIVLLVIVGCILESYINPYLLGGLLKIF